MVGRALSRAHHSSVWTASSLRVLNVRPWTEMLTCVLGIPLVDGSVRYGSVLPSLQRHMVCARARSVCAPARSAVSGVSGVGSL